MSKILMACGASKTGFGLVQNNNTISAYSGCCGASFEIENWHYYCNGCKKAFPVFRVEADFMTISSTGKFIVVPYRDIISREPETGTPSGLSRLQWWVQVWTGLDVTVEVVP